MFVVSMKLFQSKSTETCFHDAIKYSQDLSFLSTLVLVRICGFALLWLAAVKACDMSGVLQTTWHGFTRAHVNVSVQNYRFTSVSCMYGEKKYCFG